MKIRRYSNRELWVQQRGYDLKVTVLEENSHNLLAPVKGNMTRIVYESIDCSIHYRFMVDGIVVFDFVGRGSFEVLLPKTSSDVKKIPAMFERNCLTWLVIKSFEK